jgi:KipI family sensor histidine kinase inhibitor
MGTGKYRSAQYLPFGDSALLVEFGNTIDLEVNRKVIALGEAILNAQIQGVEELVPTYRSLLIRYDLSKIGCEQLMMYVKDIEGKLKESRPEAAGKIVVPVVYGGQYGPDLTHVAQYHGLTEEQVIQIHSGREYRVYMLGFVAGFPYLREVADEIATARLETPRLKVPKGSVGIAEKQAGIYPCEAPGGWQIIGRTPLRLFNSETEPPALLKPGDSVKFQQILEKEYRKIEEAVLNGACGAFWKEQRK